MRLTALMFVLTVGSCFAQRVAVTVTTPPGFYPTAGVVVTETASDTSNYNKFAVSGNGKELLFARNTDVSSHNVTLTSVADPVTGRTGTVVESIAAGAIRVYGPLALNGWRQTDGTVYCQSDHTGVKFSVVTLP